MTPIIGLEVHVELSTKSKMFCGCSAEHFGVTPNTHTCPVCLGLPGALPVPNKKAVEWTILLGLALGCKVNKESKFDRKSYFYPDLPKGYQISQYDQPLCIDGKLGNIRIRRVHLEEDTGKLQHAEIDGEKISLVDFNRSGVPLVEIVTEPDFRSIEEVDVYLKNLQRIIRYLGISGADMEKGSMRLEPSISIRASGQHLQGLSLQNLPPYRVELKNINSFRFARKALEHEIKRQAEILERGEEIKQQTRGWSEAKNETVPQREKEEANDYRYFPEPDIPPMRFTSGQILAIKKQLPELPDAKLARFVRQYNITQYTANILVDNRQTAEYFELAVQGGKGQVDHKDIANWIVNKKEQLPEVPADLVRVILQTRMTTKIGGEDLDRILAQNQKAVQDYRSGKTAALGIIIGAVRAKTGNINQTTIAEIKKRLEN